MRAVLFDLDQTLYPEADFVRSGFRAVARFAAGRLGADAGDLEVQMLSILRIAGRGRVFDELLAREDRRRLLSVETLVHVYRTHEPRIQLHADAADCLRQLRGPLGLVTDGHATVQWSKIRALGLDARLAAIVCTADLGPGAGKPAESGYRVCLERLGVGPREAVYVGDDPAKDFAAPRALGMRTVRVVRAVDPGFDWSTPGPVTEADHVVSDLRDAKEFLQ